jgi:hypothetical protein
VPTVRQVVTTRDVHPHDAGWFQVQLVLLQENRIIDPEGGEFLVRFGPSAPFAPGTAGTPGAAPGTRSPGGDAGPWTLDGVVWERFDPVTRNLAGLWQYRGVRDKVNPREWRSCAVLLKLPRDQIAAALPAGTGEARVRIEFRHPDPARSALPETIFLPLREIAEPLQPVRPPTAAAKTLKLERTAARPEAAEEVINIALLDGQGGFTLPAGELTVSVTDARPGETEGPANPESYTVLPADAWSAPTVTARRIERPASGGAGTGAGATGAAAVAEKSAPPAVERFEYRRRLLIDRARLAETLPPGSARAWVRVDFQPSDLDGKPLSATVAVPVRGR